MNVEKNTYYLIYITKAVWFKCRLYEAVPVRSIAATEDAKQLEELKKEAKGKDKFLYDEGDKGSVTLFQIKHINEYQTMQSPDPNNIQSILKGFAAWSWDQTLGKSKLFYTSSTNLNIPIYQI